ncbi:MAG: hydrogenase maturation nickel metallochaperone HypA [Syntrophales bacterium]|nr:hydrogenase maturation nickel metallochaperone HypA [Syntrophales bacterium]
MIEEYAAREKFRRVLRIRLSTGKFSGVVPTALRFAFDLQSQGTVAEGAQIQMEILPAALYCFGCGKEIEVEYFDAICPQCEGSMVILVRGTEELKLMELEVE